MRSVAIALPLLLAASAAQGVDHRVADTPHAPLYLEGGLSYLGAQARELTTSRGLHLGFGYVSDDAALLMQTGFGGVDMDWRHAARDSNRLDTVSVCYTERAYGIIGDLYIGYGVGSCFNRLEVHSSTRNGVDKAWRIAAKAMVGYVIGGGLIVEAAYHYSGKVADISSGGFTLSAGLWF